MCAFHGDMLTTIHEESSKCELQTLKEIGERTCCPRTPPNYLRFVEKTQMWSFMDQFVLSDLSHLPGPAYCVYQIHYVCDVHNYLLLSGRGGKTCQRRA